ncbi:MAG: enoyl-CoA hydratase/isomerase [Frankiales bacterium]|nr:enoyl-CoA hydratase/isomerase [Frankiales bacterium]
MISREGTVLVVSHDDGENRFTTAALAAWEQALDEVEKDESVSALVTTGAGKFYSNGLDVDELSGADGRAYVDRVCGLLARVLALPVVTVAAVNGHAFGAGAMMLLAHDLRVMREDRGFFCLPEVDLGLPFAPFMSSLVRTKLSPLASQEAMTTGHRYGGQPALERGIVHAVAAEDQVLPQALALATERGGKQRAAVDTIKRDIYAAVLAHGPQA